ncbi:GD16234 [Drosophila simulans]|uniref:GD16234 n=1 Tax=Drosophila simulans TaxID=7240 RepID=B4R528_DROSI|nr:GD16234 [Drosophila simulans]
MAAVRFSVSMSLGVDSSEMTDSDGRLSTKAAKPHPLLLSSGVCTDVGEADDLEPDLGRTLPLTATVFGAKGTGKCSMRWV